jgi:hypothetical protein
VGRGTGARKSQGSANSSWRSGTCNSLPGASSQTWPGSGSGFTASGFRSSTRVQWVGSCGRLQASPGGTQAQR